MVHFWLVYLGGIKTKAYRAELNPLSIKYDATRKRILKDVTDYDEVVKKEVVEKEAVKKEAVKKKKP